jgi:EmrB/QacA subfamily drug resistance transporter
VTTPSSDPDPRRWWALFLLCTAQFLVILDTSIVGIALPALQRALGFDAAGLQWIFNAYVVAFGGLLLLGGRLADLFGPRRLFGIGFAILTLSSLVAGIATTPATLLAARAIQGAGAALIAPAALSMVMALFGARPMELRRALGFWGASAAAGGTAGVFLGGVITEWLSWRWTFLINVPIGALVLLATPAWLPRGLRRSGSVDVAGAISVTAAVALAVYAIVTANEPAVSTARTLLLLGVSAALFLAFVGFQRVRREPLVPLSLFRAPNLAAGNLVMTLLGAAWIPMWFFLNMYLQEVLGYGAFDSGLALLPMTLTIMLLMVGATEKVVGRIGPKTALVIGLGTLGLALVLFSRMPLGGSFVGDVLLPSLLGAIGMSLAYIPAMITSTAGARPEDGGLASGLVNTTYQVGSAIGLAAMVAVAGSRTSGLAGTGAEAVAAMNGGFAAAFLGAAGIAFLAALIAGFAVRGSRPSPQAAAVAVMLVVSLLVGGCASKASPEHQGHDEHAPAVTQIVAATPVLIDAAAAAEPVRAPATAPVVPPEETAPAPTAKAPTAKALTAKVRRPKPVAVERKAAPAPPPARTPAAPATPPPHTGQPSGHDHGAHAGH